MVRRVCIVSPGNLGSNPRLVKEADALNEAGYDVQVVACDYAQAWKAYDDEIAAKAGWKVVRVRRLLGERLLNRSAKPIAKLLARLGLGIPLQVAANAYGGPSSALARAVSDVKADLYIAHYIPALPAALAAARHHGARLGFDAEDFHSGEGIGGPGDDFRMDMAARVEAACVPACAYVTAASPLIGKAYASRYGVEPRTVLNVFPLNMAPANLSSHCGEGLKAYWFSQTIGPDRGLQSFLRAMARTAAVVTLDIRGSNRWGHGDMLLALARELGIGDRVRLLPVEAPGEMVQLAAPYDLGLSLETDVSENRRLCLTNKIFTYLLAGVPAMISDTPAQKALAADLGAAAALVSLADVEDMARTLDDLARPETLRAAKAKAAALGRERYNWDVEKSALLAAVATAFDQPASVRS